MIVFHHIPKTAGSTFHAVLSQQYPKSKIFTINGLNPKESLIQYKSLSSKKINSLELLKGHLADKFISDESNSVKKIVFVRDPYDLFISSYYYIKRAKHNLAHEKVKKMTFDEFIDFRAENNFTNQQTKHLIGYTDIENRGALTDVNPTLLHKQMVSKVPRIDFLYTVDYFDEAIYHLYKVLEWKKKPYYVRRNETFFRLSVNDLTDSQKEKIYELTKVDLELYRYASKRSLILEEYRLQKSYNKFLVANRFYNIYSRSKKKINALIKL